MRTQLTIALLTLMLACKSPAPPQRSVVIQGFLHAGNPISAIELSLVEPFNTQANTEPVTDALVFLTYGNETLPLVQTQTAGYYAPIENTHIVKPGENYQLNIEYKEAIIEAVTVIPPMPINLKLDTDTLDTTNPFSAINVRWSADEKGWFLGVIEPVNPDSTEFPFNNFFSLPVQDSTLHIGAENIQSKGKHIFILHSITKEYADIYRISSSSIGSSNAGNIANGFGIFTGFASDTVSFYVK